MSDLREEFATALRYKPGEDNAPVIVAAGQGLKARQIKKIAEKSGVPLYQDQALAKTLYNLGIGVEIPPRLYEAMARVLVFVMKLDKKAPGS
ncbi:MAG: Flagellar biosynthetic protein FlhB [Firmicutes bacterium ADurb.Bin373]|nr:MAG: Flagellar biosynthetic protein FlhB [Firmicutes bacterium ADurb.Bin373]